MRITPDTFILWSGWFFAFFGFLFGWWQHRCAARDRGELVSIRRRAVAPYLAPSPQRFEHVYDDGGEPGSINYWRAYGSNVLCAVCDEVSEDMDKGDPVIFVVENHGKSCPRVLVKLDGEKIALLKEPDFDGANGLQFLRYPFDPAVRGKKQTIKLWFECDGIQDTHTYATLHGKRVLERIDPA